MAIDTVVVDYGGVLTNPLVETFVAFAELAGLGAQDLAQAFVAATKRYGHTPMAALETGGISERQMTERILAELPKGAGGVLEEGHSFGELWFRGRRPNEPFLAFLHSLRRRGYRLALLTNNVREWEPLWRAQLPVDELFEVVVDSHREGVRKPDPTIYRTLLDRLGADAGRCLFVDDTEENCAAAEVLGIRAVRFTDTDTAIEEIATALGHSAETGGSEGAPAGRSYSGTALAGMLAGAVPVGAPQGSQR
ncbi:HAD family hydrolase [Streptomyces albipurpureus]|uniref:HAD family phosphatase n=1 Tax=Streptomyces albipurpureus TaxID=2897419 RepID=A0ABT0UX97_9ACTN|nr:HAD family phosphatase [Streptomyces sp. CWNU-1]MCM2391796.1 HAD family phosphatase [Streptomyces sp. CWNU-1]